MAGKKNGEPRFIKARLIKSRVFSGREKDLLWAILEDAKEYSVSEAKTLILKEKERVIR